LNTVKLILIHYVEIEKGVSYIILDLGGYYFSWWTGQQSIYGVPSCSGEGHGDKFWRL